MMGNRPQSWSACLLGLGLLLCFACGGQRGVILDIGGLPDGTQSLIVQSTLNGQPGQELSFQPSMKQFVIFVPEGTSGSLMLTLTALGESGCKVASAQQQVDVGSGLRRIPEIQVTLLPLTPARCTLTATVPSGTVSSAMPGQFSCAAGQSPCVADFDQGTVVQLQTPDGTPSTVPHWSADCAGYGPCKLVMNRPHKVAVGSQPRTCMGDNWCVYSPLPQANSLKAVSVSSDGDSWAVGDRATLLHCRNGACTAIPTGTTNNLVGVGADASSNIWIMGGDALLQCSATGCNLPTGSRTCPLGVSMAGMDVSSSGAVWTVGNMVVCSYGADGYNRVATSTSDLRSVAVDSSGAAWTVGSGGTVLRCTGATPTAPAGCTELTPPGSTNNLTSVSAAADGSVWAAGHVGTVLTCNAQGCKAVPISGGSTVNLRAVSALSSEQAWAVGDSGVVLSCSSTACTSISNQNSNTLYTVGAPKDGKVWVGGGTGSAEALMQCSTTGCTLVNLNLFGQTLRGMNQDSADETWAVGDGGALVRCNADGCAAVSFGPVRNLRNLRVAAGGEAWAAGDSGAVLRCTGAGCLAPAPSTTADLFSISPGNSSDAWATGSKNPGTVQLFSAVVRCTTSSCTTAPVSSAGQPNGLRSVVVTQTGEAWITGDYGEARYCFMNSCTTPTGLVGGSSMFALATGGMEQVWMGGMVNDNTPLLGSCVRQRGTQCARIPLITPPTNTILQSLSATSTGDTWAFGNNGYVVLCGKSSSSCMRIDPSYNSIPGTAVLTRSSIDRSDGAWVASATGVIGHCTQERQGTCVVVNDIGLVPDDLSAGPSGDAWVVPRGSEPRHCTLTPAGCTASLTTSLFSLRTVGAGPSGEVWVAGDSGLVLRRAP